MLVYTITGSGNHMEEFLQHVKQSVSNDMNNQLLCEFTEEEVRQGLDAIGDLKAPGADGMSSLFYKKHWSIVGADMVREVLTFLNEGCMPAKWNETVVMLIPKNKRSGGKEFAALKLDMSKAYNRVEWNYSEKIMLKMCMGYTKGPSAPSALELEANGRIFDGNLTASNVEALDALFADGSRQPRRQEIRPSRGLRQGDPLSPYLFLLCAKGFSSMLNAAEESGRLHEITICANAPSITHLLFADDALLLLKANQENATYLQYRNTI
ncbi:uncharacterized protein [Miscanthus floridulus]|uniref:uncharacterized protein n=1 Tax=Miscanthus floridulus TaxID=154761 RepID=UPI0034585F9B